MINVKHINKFAFIAINCWQMIISDYYISIHTKQSDEQDTISNPLPIESIQLVERMQVMIMGSSLVSCFLENNSKEIRNFCVKEIAFMGCEVVM